MIAQLPGFEWWTSQVMPALVEAMRWLLPEQWGELFMIRALLVCIALAPMCAAMGVKVVNFRMAFFSDAISHSAFAGVAVGFLLHSAYTEFDPRISLVLLGMLVGLGIAAVRRHTELSTDTIIGVFFSTVVALGIAFITVTGQTVEFQTYLYGSILTLDDVDLLLAAILAVVVMLFMGVGFNSLMLIGLNEELAHSRRIRVRLMNYLFAMLLALVIMALIRTAGILLVTAMLIVPAATARNLARSMAGMFWWAMLVALVSCLAGTFASFSDALGNVGTGSVIVLAAALLFGVSLTVRRA